MICKFQGKEPKIHPTAYVAPGAQLIGDVELEENSIVLFNAVLRGDNEKIRIGKRSNVQDGTVVHADPGFPVNVGENVTIGHNVILHGCTVKDGALIGMGAIIMNGAVIGEGALVAAGALVSEGKVVEPGTLVAGVPAKVVRQLRPEELEHLKRSAEHYVEKGKAYRQERIGE